MQTILLRYRDQRFLVERGRLCAGAGEVLKSAARDGDEKLILVYRSARLRRVYRTVETSTGPARRLCTKHEITQRLVYGRPRPVGDDGDFVWVFDQDDSQVLPV